MFVSFFFHNLAIHLFWEIFRSKVKKLLCILFFLQWKFVIPLANRFYVALLLFTKSGTRGAVELVTDNFTTS